VSKGEIRQHDNPHKAFTHTFYLKEKRRRMKSPMGVHAPTRGRPTYIAEHSTAHTCQNVYSNNYSAFLTNMHTMAEARTPNYESFVEGLPAYIILAPSEHMQAVLQNT
jgi:hypothetical protein